MSDVTVREPVHRRVLIEHLFLKVCGLKWSPDRQLLASGGNDNKLMVWNLSNTTPYQQYSDHVAAVKAIAWSPHQVGPLFSFGSLNALTFDWL